MQHARTITARLLTALLLAAAASLTAQSFTEITLTQPAPPTVTSVNVTNNTPGATSYYYWIVARYPIGKSLPYGPIEVKNGPNTLSGGTPISLQWTAPPAAYGFDVLRSTNAQALRFGFCNCAISLNQTDSTITDTGAVGGVSYTVTPTQSVKRTLLLNNTDTAAPKLAGFDTVTVWEKHTLTRRGNGQDGCSNSGGCWYVDGRFVANAAAALSQSITISSLPAKTWVNSTVIKNANQFSAAGASAIVMFLGTTSDGSFFVGGSGLNLAAAPSDTNFARNATNSGNNTFAATSIRATVQVTGAFVEELNTGVSVDIWIQYSILP